MEVEDKRGSEKSLEAFDQWTVGALLYNNAQVLLITKLEEIRKC
jgi:hypothetical protein